MLVQRLCTLSDLPEVERLAASSPMAVTSLPADRQRLADMIETSVASMAAEVSFSGEESYFFALEESETGRLVGCSSIVAAAGFSQPFYTFRNEMFLHASRELGLHNRIHVLSLCHDLTGHSLLAGFQLEPGFQHDRAAWELNARGRLLFMGAHPQRFAETTVVEIAGVSDGAGNSPFWDAVGRHFFAVSYLEAEQIGSDKGRSFLAELMPGYPIYVPMLSDAAQEVIGQVSPAAEPVFDILLREGFETDDYVDIFDGGPVVHGSTGNLRTISRSRCFRVEIGNPGQADGACLVANAQVSGFRAAAMNVALQPGNVVVLTHQQADLLQVVEGDSVRLVRES